MNIALETILAKLPIMEIKTTIQSHVEPLMEMLPDRRMKKVLESMILGILGGQTPVITGMARQNGKAEGETWAVAKSIYRLLGNKRLETEVIYQGLYQVGQKVVERENPDYLVVAVDPVNFEKPYTKALEGVSVVHKATPPDLTGHPRLAHGYPAITVPKCPSPVTPIGFRIKPLTLSARTKRWNRRLRRPIGCIWVERYVLWVILGWRTKKCLPKS